MKKSQTEVFPFRGEITVFMALVFVLMLSVVGALIESASIQITKNRKRTDTLLALESTFAEFHPELLEQYDIFARFGCTEEVLQYRLSYYGAKNMDHSVKKIQLLTDYHGTPFYQQSVRYMKDWLGIKDVDPDSEYDFSEDPDLQEEENLNMLELEGMLAEEGVELPTEDNPLENIENIKNSAMLSILVSNQEELSNQSIQLEKLPSKRQLQKGNYPEEKDDGTTDKAFFVAYLVEHYSDFINQKEDTALLYELEYILGGYSSDKENLETVGEKLVNIRTAANYTYLMTSPTRQAEADAMATTICVMIAMPYLKDIVKLALLFAWAYGESIIDVRALLKDKKVPFIKNDESWQLQLSSLITLGTSSEDANEKDTIGGLSYQDYLKGLLLLEDKETLSMRCLDLIESNLGIKTDQCMTKVVIESSVNLRRGIEDTFITAFGYQ